LHNDVVLYGRVADGVDGDTCDAVCTKYRVCVRRIVYFVRVRAYINNNKSSAVAEMGDRLATIDMGAAKPFGGNGSPSNTV